MFAFKLLPYENNKNREATIKMWPVTQKGTSWVDDVISRKHVLKLTSRRAKIAHLRVFQRDV